MCGYVSRYYNRFIFPKIGAVADRFYQYFEPIYYLKPLRDKGFTGWLYRVYPEPWQVRVCERVNLLVFTVRLRVCLLLCS